MARETAPRSGLASGDGAKDWLLAWCQADPRAVLRSGPALDRAAASAAAERLLPGRRPTPMADGTAGENANPDDGELYVGVWPGLTLACTGIAALDQPSRLPRQVLTAFPADLVYLHAMHSVVDWFAHAVWIDGGLTRSLSLSPDSGIMENVGAPAPFEAPFRAGDPDPCDIPLAGFKIA